MNTDREKRVKTYNNFVELLNNIRSQLSYDESKIKRLEEIEPEYKILKKENKQIKSELNLATRKLEIFKENSNIEICPECNGHKEVVVDIEGDEFGNTAEIMGECAVCKSSGFLIKTKKGEGDE